MERAEEHGEALDTAAARIGQRTLELITTRIVHAPGLYRRWANRKEIERGDVMAALAGGPRPP